MIPGPAVAGHEPGVGERGGNVPQGLALRVQGVDFRGHVLVSRDGEGGAQLRRGQATAPTVLGGELAIGGKTRAGCHRPCRRPGAVVTRASV